MLCLKYVFFVINFLLFCLGVATSAVGIWTIMDPTILQNYTQLSLEKLTIVSYIITVVGFVLVIIGFIGCCGVLLDNACCLCLFCTIMIILLILGAVVVGIIWVAMRNDTLGNKLKDLLFQELEKNEIFDRMQKDLKCCGVSGINDYVERRKEAPLACRDEYNNLYEIGCWEKIKTTLTEKSHILAGMSATLIGLGIISVIVSFIIMCTAKQAAKAI